MCGTLDARLPSRLALGQQLHVVVDDDDGVVDNHSQGDDEGGKGHGVQLDAEGIEQSQGDEDADGYGFHDGNCPEG